MILPLSVLSYTSIIGIISTLLIIAVILIDGFSKPDSPGSLWSPAETSLGIRGVGELGLSFGLFMAGVSRLSSNLTYTLLIYWSAVLWTRRHPVSGPRHG